MYPRPGEGVNAAGPEIAVCALSSARWGLLRWRRQASERFPEPRAKSAAKMWTLWKTQDWSVPRLWITHFGRLLSGGPSARIGGVARRRRMARGTLKTPVQTVWHRSHTIEASVPTPAVIHSFSGGAGASSSLIHRMPGGTHPERRNGGRYTPHLVFRLLWEPLVAAGFPHLWKGLCKGASNRRSKALTTEPLDVGELCGYASEQVFYGRFRGVGLWIAAFAARGEGSAGR